MITIQPVLFVRDKREYYISSRAE